MKKYIKQITLIVPMLVSFFVANAVFAHSNSWLFTENNNNAIHMQTKGGDPRAPGDVKIEFYGHMAFKITSPEGLSIMIDPWRNDPSGAWGLWFPKEFPATPVDIVLSTHAHFDHDAVYRTHAITVLERLAGEFKLGDVKITGIAEKHMCKSKGWYNWTEAAKEFNQDFCPPDNFLHMDNFIQIIETGGMRIAHWGDNRPLPARFADRMLRNIDVLIMNIDGSRHILSYDDIDMALKRYNPKVVIPGHYYTKGASSVLTTLSTADEWVDRQPDVVRLNTSKLILNPDKIKYLDSRVYYFGMNHVNGMDNMDMDNMDNMDMDHMDMDHMDKMDMDKMDNMDKMDMKMDMDHMDKMDMDKMDKMDMKMDMDHMDKMDMKMDMDKMDMKMDMDKMDMDNMDHMDDMN